MAKYDPDRIAALASGSLDPEEAAVLEAEIAADPRAAAELAAQRLALQAIRRTPAPLLSAAERTELRRAVADALHLEVAPAPRPAAGRRRIAWRPVAVAAAALAAVVAAVPLIGLLSTGGDDAMTTVALEATTTLPRDAAFATADTESTEQNLAGEGTYPEVTALGGTLATSDAPAARLATPAEKAVQDLAADPAPLFASVPVDSPPCAHQARILLRVTDPAPALLPLGDSDGLLAFWFLSEDGATVRELLAFDPASCELLAVYP